MINIWVTETHVTVSYFERNLFLESATGMEKKINNKSSHKAGKEKNNNRKN